MIQKKREALKVSSLFIIKFIFGALYLIAPIITLTLQLTDDNSDNLPTGVIVTNSALIGSGILYLALLEMTRRNGAITSGTLTVFWVVNTAVFWMYWTTVYQQDRLVNFCLFFDIFCIFLFLRKLINLSENFDFFFGKFRFEKLFFW